METGNIEIEPMAGDFVLWRCLHHGPLSRDTIDQWPVDSNIPWERYRTRNQKLLAKLTEVYGTCAILARDGNFVVGILRFYPKAVWEMEGAGGLCLQQDYPAGPKDDFAELDFPPRQDLKDQTLKIHCFMTGSPLQKENPYQRQGLATEMVRTLINWAKENEWKYIEADSFEDLPIIYQVTGSAGYAFWEKLGFYIAYRFPHPHLKGHDQFVKQLEDQARAKGMDTERAKDQIVMRLDLV